MHRRDGSVGAAPRGFWRKPPDEQSRDKTSRPDDKWDRPDEHAQYDPSAKVGCFGDARRDNASPKAAAPALG